MNKVCVVTGGAAGIGRCIVEMFAESGYTVYFIDKTPEAVELAEGKMSERGLSRLQALSEILPRNRRCGIL